MTHLGNGLVELDGAIDAAVYDRASREPSFEADEDSFRVVVDSIGGGDRRNNPTETHVASQTIFSNFINGNDRQASPSIDHSSPEVVGILELRIVYCVARSSVVCKSVVQQKKNCLTQGFLLPQIIAI